MNVSQSPLVQALLAHFDLEPDAYPPQPQWNIAPSDSVPVIARPAGSATQLMPMKWWLVPRWSKTAQPSFTMFNARSETAASSKAFAAPLKTQRAIVPIHSFVEWQKRDDNKQPWAIVDDHQPPRGQALAAIWECWQDELYSFAILTQRSDASFETLHKRMPIWLGVDDWDAWLDAENEGDHMLPDLCGRRPALKLTPLSTRINNARNKERPSRLKSPPGIYLNPESQDSSQS